MDADPATILLDQDGRYLDASQAALELLGVSLDRLRAMSGADFAVEPQDPASSEAFRATWDRDGRVPIYGVTILRRPDGEQVRVRFVIEEQEADRLRATLEAIDQQAEGATRVFTLGDVLAEWRAAERRLAAVPPDSDESRSIRGDVEALRARYQRAFEVRRRESPS